MNQKKIESIISIYALLPKIERKYQNDKFQKEIKVYKSLINKKIATNIEKIAFNFSVGIKQWEYGLYKDAERSFSEVLYLKYEFVPALIMRALCFKKTGEIKNAVDDALSALLYDKNNANTLFVNSIIMLNHDKKTALEKINKAIKIDNKNYFFIAFKAIILDKMHKTKEALITINKISDETDLFFFNFLKGYFNKKNRNYTEAIHYLKKSNGYPPSDYSLIFFYKNKRKSLSILHRLLRSDKFKSLARFALFEYYFKKKSYKTAAIIITRLAVQYPNDFYLSILAAKTLYLTKCYESGFIAIKKALILPFITGNLNLEIEYALIMKVKILLKIKNSNRDEVIITLKKLENRTFFPKEKKMLYLERFYRKTYEKFSFYIDYKKVKELRKLRNLLTTTKKKEFPAHWKKIFIAVIISLIIIFLIIDYLSKYFLK